MTSISREERVATLLDDWQRSRSEWHGPVTLEVVREYAEWREALSPDERLIEALGEALFILSDRLRASGVLSASDRVHVAYENVVSAFSAIGSTTKADHHG